VVPAWQRVRHGRGGLDVAGSYQDAVSGLGELSGHLLADAARRSGDQGDGV